MCLLPDLEAFHLLQEVSRPVRRLQREAPHCRLIKACDAVEERRFACAVRTNHARDLTALCLKADVIDGREAAVAHGEMLDRQQSRNAALRHGCSFANHYAAPAAEVFL